jgi:hypothetical protein
MPVAPEAIVIPVVAPGEIVPEIMEATVIVVPEILPINTATGCVDCPTSTTTCPASLWRYAKKSVSTGVVPATVVALIVVEVTTCDVETWYVPVLPVVPVSCDTIVPPAAVSKDIPTKMVPEAIALTVRVVPVILPVRTVL